jgi:polar amino acid transport system permease protein
MTGTPTEMAEGETEVAEGPRALLIGRKRLHWGWWLLTAAVVVALASLIRLIVTNPNFGWSVVGEYFTADAIIAGLGRTLLLTLVGMVAGVAIGVVMAVMRLSPVPVLSAVSWLYIWFFRGTPLLVQIIFWYNLASLLPTISIGIPFGGTTFWSGDTNVLVTPFVAAVLGLGLNEGAYMAEIVRGGILSVDHGQREAAKALGMTESRSMRRIILPQAMRVVIPPTGNQLISMLKSSSLVSVTSLPELLYASQLIYQQTFQTIPLLIVASIWYLIVTSILTVGQYYLERHYARGSRANLPLTPLQKAQRAWGGLRLRLSAEQGDHK